MFNKHQEYDYLHMISSLINMQHKAKVTLTVQHKQAAFVQLCSLFPNIKSSATGQQCLMIGLFFTSSFSPCVCIYFLCTTFHPQMSFLLSFKGIASNLEKKKKVLVQRWTRRSMPQHDKHEAGSLRLEKRRGSSMFGSVQS